MPDATAPSAHALTGEGAPPAVSRPRLTFADRLAILKIRRQRPDLSVNAIAQLYGCSHESVARILAAHDADVKELTQQVMQTDIPQALEEWAAARQEAALKGNHKPSMDWLVAASAIDAQQPTANVNLGFQLVLAPRFGTPAHDAVNEPAPTVVCSADPPRAAYAAATQDAQTLSASSAPALHAPALDAPRTTLDAAENPTHTAQSAQRTTHNAPSPPAPTRIRRSAKR